LSWLEFSFVIFFFKTLWIDTVFLHMIFFCYGFFKIIFVDFIFLILSWSRIIITIKLNHVGKHYSFHHKTLWITTVSPYTVFFSYDFFKIVFIDFIFLILSWLRITITSKVKHVEKHCSFPHKTLWIATVFPTWFFSVFLCFFVMFFFKIIFFDFIFLILSWL
jgi:hypothetical protein